MIKTIKFKFGTHQTQAPLSMDVTPITVFVGPNNSGKSKVLVEIENYCRRTRPQANDVILNQLEFGKRLIKCTIQPEGRSGQSIGSAAEASYNLLRFQPMADGQRDNAGKNRVSGHWPWLFQLGCK